MMGRNPLWVAKQHGHSISTMLSIYAAWVDGALEVDVETIRESMNAGAQRSHVGTLTVNAPPLCPEVVQPCALIKARKKQPRQQRTAPNRDARDPVAVDGTSQRRFGSEFGSETWCAALNYLKNKEKTWRRGWDSNKEINAINDLE
jgi:hypothetical protein